MQLLRKRSSAALRALLLCLLAVIIYPLNLHAATKKKFVVVIDAGHGGSDVGANENGVKEKDINLAVALKLGDLIKKKMKDTEVVYTRSTDEFISLQKRADIANKAKGDLFISIHCNSVDRSNKNRSNVLGATTYVLGHHKDADNLAVAQRENAVVELDADDSAHFSEFDPTSDESHIIFEMTQKKNFQNSIRFASAVQKEMTSAGRYSRGVQQAGFWVLWSTAMPAALIELDFICNPDQAKYLSSKEGQEKLANAILGAVKTYETYFRKSLGLAMAEQEEKDGEELLAAASTSTRASEPVKVSMAELPKTEARAEERTHRTQAAQPRTSDPSNHRRRSSASRNKGAETVEETVIAFADENESQVVVVEEEVETAASQKEEKKADGKASKKEKKAESGKPARRDKGSGKKAKRQSLSVGYKVLLFESDQELLASDEAFKGLKPVASFRENNIYKYTYGESADRREMESLLDEIEDLFPDARVIKCYY